MDIIRDDDVTVFTDDAGDTLTLLRKVRQRDRAKVAEAESKQSLDALASIGMTMKEAIEDVGRRTREEQAAAEALAERAPASPAIRRLRLLAVARAMSVGGQPIARDAVMEAYDCMPKESVAWVDAQVDTVWAAADPGDAERES
jgi:hypothetical protein